MIEKDDRKRSIEKDDRKSMIEIKVVHKVELYTIMK